MAEEHDPRIQRVVDAGARAGIDVSVQRFPEGTHTAEDAARAIGCTLAQIVKTLVFVDGDGEPVAFLVSGANRLDPAKGAAAAGLPELRKADARATKERTGFSIGGIPPFGHEHPVPLYLDADLLAFDEIWAAAGHPNGVFRLSPQQLEALTGAPVCDVTPSPQP